MITEEDIIEEEAEQASCDQYDKQIVDYYETAREKSRAVRQGFEENLIEKLVEELRWIEKFIFSDLIVKIEGKQ